MRFINRVFALSAAVLIMTAAGSASAAWNFDGKQHSKGRVSHQVKQPTSAISGAGEAPRSTSTPLYAKPRCSTVKPFVCKPKRTDSMASQ